MKLIKLGIALSLLSSLVIAESSYSRSENFGKNGVFANILTNNMNYDEYSRTSTVEAVNQNWKTGLFDQIGGELGFKYSFSKIRSKNDFYLVGSYSFYEGESEINGEYNSGEVLSSKGYSDMKNLNLFLGFATSSKNKIDKFLEVGLDYRIQNLDSKTTDGGYNTTYNLPIGFIKAGFLYPVTKYTKIGLSISGMYGIGSTASVKNYFDSGTEIFYMDSVYGASLKIPITIKSDRHTYWDISYSFEKLFIENSSSVEASIQGYSNNYVKPNSEQTTQKITIGFNYLF